MEMEGYHTSTDSLHSYVNNVIQSTADNISSLLQDLRCQRHTEIDYITGYLLRRARSHGMVLPENTRLYDLIKRKENEYERIGAGLPYSQSEETEAVTTIDILVRAGIEVTTASVASDGSLEIVCSRGVRLLADTRLVDVADQKFDVVVLMVASKVRSASAIARC